MESPDLGQNISTNKHNFILLDIRTGMLALI